MTPATSWDGTLGNVRPLDMWHEQIGLKYAAEKPERKPLLSPKARTHPIARSKALSASFTQAMNACRLA